eukprot:62563-Chlamydomonas_euryale.AAC.3
MQQPAERSIRAPGPLPRPDRADVPAGRPPPQQPRRVPGSFLPASGGASSRSVVGSSASMLFRSAAAASATIFGVDAAPLVMSATIRSSSTCVERCGKGVEEADEV